MYCFTQCVHLIRYIVTLFVICFLLFLLWYFVIHLHLFCTSLRYLVIYFLPCIVIVCFRKHLRTTSMFYTLHLLACLLEPSENDISFYTDAFVICFLLFLLWYVVFHLHLLACLPELSEDEYHSIFHHLYRSGLFFRKHLCTSLFYLLYIVTLSCNSVLPFVSWWFVLSLLYFICVHNAKYYLATCTLHILIANSHSLHTSMLSLYVLSRHISSHVSLIICNPS